MRQYAPGPAALRVDAAGWRCARCRPPRCSAPSSAASVSTATASSRLALLLLGSTALTAHVFVFNDWAGYSSDARDPRRASLGPTARDQPGSDRARRDRAADPGQCRPRRGRRRGDALRRRDRRPQPPVLVLAEARQEHADRGVAQPPDRRRAALPARLHDGCTRWTREASRSASSSVSCSPPGTSTRRCATTSATSPTGSGRVPWCSAAGGRFSRASALFTAAYLLIVGLAALGVLPSSCSSSAVAWLLQAAWSLRGAAARPGTRDRVVDAAPVPAALRAGRSRDARQMSRRTPQRLLDRSLRRRSARERLDKAFPALPLSRRKSCKWTKPSDGLEPSTPSLPFLVRRGKRGHCWVLATTKAAQTEGI